MLIFFIYFLTARTARTKLGEKFNYHIIAEFHARRIADDVNEKMQYLHRNVTNKFELVGHSIGAHAVGQAAHFFKRNTGFEVDQIIGSLFEIEEVD